MRITLLPLVLFALAVGPAYARAQTPGEDDCNNGGTVISGLGVFIFDNTNAAMGAEGQNESLCYQFGSSSVDHDVWFAWTAPTTSTFIVNTCESQPDTKIAAYPGNGCPATGSALDCNDDTCNLQSEITFQGTAGSSYMLQIGTFPGAPGGPGNLIISSSGPSGPGNDDCSSPAEIPSGPGTFPYDCTSATTGNEGQGEILCYAFGTSSIKEDVWFVWTASFTGMAEMTTCGLTDDDTKIAIYPFGAAGACPQAGSAIACNDDACGLQSTIAFAAVGGAMYSIQIGRSPLAGGGATASGNFKILQTPPSWGRNYGVGYSGDYKGPLHGQLDVHGNPIYESDLCIPAGGAPQLGGASGPQILISGAQLGLTPQCSNPAPGVPCRVEVDAFSRGRDDPLQPVLGEGGHIFFSVDEWAKGVPSTMIDSNGNAFIVEPSVNTEGAGGASEASADVFTLIPGLLPGPLPPPQAGAPSGNLAVLDGDGRRSASGHQYPGVGLVEPNPPSPGADNAGSNADILDLSPIDSNAEGSISSSNPAFFSLDGDIFDPFEQMPNSGSAGANNQFPGDILIADGTQTLVYATASQLGIESDGVYNDIDALVLWDNGDNVYQPASHPYQWTEDFDGDGIMDADMLLFSVRRGSPIIGSLDSIFGLPIEPGDLLVPPVSMHGSNLTAGPGTPGVFVAAETMGLRTSRGGAEESDDLNSADVSSGAVYDCNENGKDDAIDCSDGTSDDNNLNGIPDECEDIVEFCSGQALSSALTSHCPCGNSDTESVGLAGCGNGNSVSGTYTGASLRATGSNSVTTSSSTWLTLEGSGLIKNQPGLYFQGNNAINNGDGVHFGDGLRCAGGSVIRLQVRVADTAGISETSIDIVAKGGVSSGDIKYYQLWYRDPASSLCGSTFNLTNGVEVLFTP